MGAFACMCACSNHTPYLGYSRLSTFWRGRAAGRNEVESAVAGGCVLWLQRYRKWGLLVGMRVWNTIIIFVFAVYTNIVLCIRFVYTSFAMLDNNRWTVSQTRKSGEVQGRMVWWPRTAQRRIGSLALTSTVGVHCFTLNVYALVCVCWFVRSWRVVFILSGYTSACTSVGRASSNVHIRCHFCRLTVW